MNTGFALCIIGMTLALFITLSWQNSCTAAVYVSTVNELVNAVTAANTGSDHTILVNKGTYDLNGEYLRITADNVTVRSTNGARSDVVLDGNYVTTEIFQILASNVTIADMTLQKAQDHPIHMMGADDHNISGVLIENVHIIDPGQQAVKINAGGSGHSADQGIIRDSLLELTAAGRTFVWDHNGSCYTGGIDGHGATYWRIQDNEVRGFWCNGDLSEHAIHFWSNSADTLVERNLIVDCDRGIGFGLGTSGHQRGIIRNNMIYHPENHGYSDVGIGLESAPNAKVYNNTIFLNHEYANAIEYRWSVTTGVEIRNNLTNKDITSRDEASGTVSHNSITAQADWFLDATAGDLHLTGTGHGVVDTGMALPEVNDDFDQESRPQGVGVDIGADEYSAAQGSSPVLPPIFLLLLR